MFKRHVVLFSNILIIITIVVGFSIVESANIRAYQMTAKEQAENNVTVSGIDVSSQVSNMSTEQRVASQMIANDIFLQDFVKTETQDPQDDPDGIARLYKYLKNYQTLLGYDNVFFVSAATGNYYYQDGLNKTISPEDDFDSWYYNFVDLNQDYDIQIDNDETTAYSVNLFVNCRVEDDNGNLIGVAGTSRYFDNMQELLSDSSSSLGVNVYVVNIGNAHNAFSEDVDFYKSPEEAAELLNVSKDVIVDENGTDGGFVWLSENTCMTIFHNADLNWNIIVVKDISDLMQSYMVQIYKSMIGLVLVLAILITGSTILLTKTNKVSIELQNTDELTGLCNNRIFKQKYAKAVKHRGKTISLFMIDVDNFKNFNDSLGHLYGNLVLRMIADELSSAFEDAGIVGRWGGDEFIGIGFMSPEVTKNVLEDLSECIRKRKTQMPVTISCGVTKVGYGENIDLSMKRADIALYQSKERGKGRVTVI